MDYKERKKKSPRWKVRTLAGLLVAVLILGTLAGAVSAEELAEELVQEFPVDEGTREEELPETEPETEVETEEEPAGLPPELQEINIDQDDPEELPFPELAEPDGFIAEEEPEIWEENQLLEENGEAVPEETEVQEASFDEELSEPSFVENLPEPDLSAVPLSDVDAEPLPEPDISLPEADIPAEEALLEEVAQEPMQEEEPEDLSIEEVEETVSDPEEEEQPESDVADEAAEEEGSSGTNEGSLDETESDTEILLHYMDHKVENDNMELYGDLLGRNLKGGVKIIYDRLKTMSRDIINGKTTSTSINLTLGADALSYYKWKTSVPENVAIRDIVDKAIYSLYFDCPYELFWFSRHFSYTWGDSKIVRDNGYYHYTTVSFQIRLEVSTDYRISQYVVNQSRILSVQNAVRTINRIVASAAGKSDYDKLVYYKDEICRLNRYDNVAAASDIDGETNPWQLIYLFDENPSTNVVCVGYAKGFQYLCEKTHFNGNVTAYAVSGFVGTHNQSMGGHAWDIVNYNGENYLVDLTYLDTGASERACFMSRPASGSLEYDYIFYVSNNEWIVYSYWNSEYGKWDYVRQAYPDSMLTFRLDTSHMPNGFNYVYGNWRYYENGKMIKGFKTIGGKTYYFNSSGNRITGWLTLSNQRYCFNKDGVMLRGWQTVDGKRYYFASDGVMQTGLTVIGSQRYFFNSAGSMLTGWKTVGKKKYYFSASGPAVIGWQTISGKSYHFNAKGVLSTGWTKIGKKTYYFNSSGTMQKGWLKKGSKQYYLGKNGVMRTGWRTISNKKYYFGKNGVMRTGWKTISKKKYYFGKSGVMRTGWRTLKNKRYYFGKSGVMRTGWRTINNKKYYFGKNGVMRTGWVTIGSYKYYFDSKGVLKKTKKA